MNDITQPIFLNEHSMPMQRQDYHWFINLPVIIENEPFAPKSPARALRLIFDTGAYISTVSEDSLSKLGLDHLIDKAKAFPISGFGGKKGTLHYIATLPGVYIGGKVITGVRFAVPAEETGVQYEVLGANILEYMLFYFDTQNDMIYFKPNPNPKPEKGMGSGSFISSLP